MSYSPAPQKKIKLNDHQKNSLINSVRNGEYNLFLGAGVSLDSTNGDGDNLLSGSQLKSNLCKLTGARESSTLQRVFSGLTEQQIETHITRAFSGCTSGKSLDLIRKFIWRRIFTNNIDDALEHAYSLPGNFQTAAPYHFKDAFNESRTLESVPIIHLHGWVKQPERGYVFARSEYARIMSESNAWMTVLADIMPIEAFIIAGTSLDEIDLEFYLTRRSSTSQRTDRGPSFFVEPFPDAQTKNECQKYGLTLYEGTIEQFFNEIDLLVSSRSMPGDLIASDIRQLFPQKSPSKTIYAFCSDFDRVPDTAKPSHDGAKFAYGHPAEWEDLSANWDIGRGLTSRVRSLGLVDKA